MSSRCPSLNNNSLLTRGGLLHWLVVILSPDLDVAWVAHIRRNSAMGPVGPPSSLLRSVDLHVADDQLFEIQLFNIGIGFQVLQNGHHRLDGLLGPSTLHPTELLGLWGPSDASVESSEWNASLVIQDVFQITERLGDLHIKAGTGGLVGILEGDSGVE